MRLLVKYGVLCWKKSIDLSEINEGDYKMLNALGIELRIKIVAYMVKKFSDEDVLNVVEKLSDICFRTSGALFIRKGRTSFLADIIKAYVDQQDGKRFVQAYYEGGNEALRSFKFSQQSTAIFTLLWAMASARDKLENCQEYTKYLPLNISNKIWQPILMRRSPSRSFLAPLSEKLQSLANDEDLLTSILTSNLCTNEAGLEGSHVTPLQQTRFV